MLAPPPWLGHSCVLRLRHAHSARRSTQAGMHAAGGSPGQRSVEDKGGARYRSRRRAALRCALATSGQPPSATPAAACVSPAPAPSSRPLARLRGPPPPSHVGGPPPPRPPSADQQQQRPKQQSGGPGPNEGGSLHPPCLTFLPGLPDWGAHRATGRLRALGSRLAPHQLRCRPFLRGE